MSQERPSNRQQWSNPSYTSNNPNRNQSNGHNNPNLQLSISISELDHIAELLEATKEITRHFTKSYKHNKSQNTSNDNHHPSKDHNSTHHPDKHTLKSCNTNDQVNKIIGQAHNLKTQNWNLKILRTPMTLMVLIATLTLHQIQDDYHELMKLLRSN